MRYFEWFKQYQKHKFVILELLFTTGIVLLIVGVFLGKIVSTLSGPSDDIFPTETQKGGYTQEGCLQMPDGIVVCEQAAQVDTLSFLSNSDSFQADPQLATHLADGHLCSLSRGIRFNHVQNLRNAPKDVEKAVQWMTQQVGISSNFTVKIGNFEKSNTAFATIRNNQRYMVFDENKLFKTPKGTLDFVSLGILGHELGHHLAGHTAARHPNPHKKELEADRFAGFILGKLGASQKHATQWTSILSTTGSLSHPPRALRAMASQAGWKQSQLTGQTTCVNRWVGPVFHTDDQTCRMVHRCDEGRKITYKLACEQENGSWSWL